MIHPTLYVNRKTKKAKHILWACDNPKLLSVLHSELCNLFEHWAFEIEGTVITVKYGGFIRDKELRESDWQLSFDDYSEYFESFISFCEGFEASWLYCQQEAHRLGCL
jgi:hypothetical protein